MSEGIVEFVCVMHEHVPLGRKGVVHSAIDKRAVDGRVELTNLGFVGDHSCDTKFHGGAEQAVYAYDADEAQRWAQQLGKPIDAGWFGENLRTTGVPVSDAVIGSRWHVGSTILEVTLARKPCGTFARWVDEPSWVKRFTERGDIGAYLRVVTGGEIGAGDRIGVEHVPAHGVTVRQLFFGADAHAMRTLIDEPGMSPKAVRDAKAALNKLARAERGRA